MVDATLLIGTAVVGLVPLLYFYVRSFGRYWWWASASNLSIVASLGFLIATYALPVEPSAQVTDWCYTVLVGTLALIGGCLIASRRGAVRTRDLAERFYHRPLEPDMSRGTMILMSVVLCLGVLVIGSYLRKFSGNVLLRTLGQGISGVFKEEMVEIRKEAVYGSGYGSGDYMAAGYVMQFRSLLLPIIFQTCFVVLLMTKKHRGYILGIGIVSAVVCTFANGATGQRKNLVMPFALLGYLCLVQYYCSRDTIPRRPRMVMYTAGIVCLVLGILLFGVLTIALGKTEASSEPDNRVEAVIKTGFERLFTIPARSDLKAVEILRDYPPSYGQHWARILLMPLPGAIEEEITRDWSEVGTSTWLHVEHGGSHEGNAPLGLWAGIWFNFRLPGVILLGLLTGYLTQCYDRWSFRRRKTPLGIVCWQVAGLSLATAPTPGHLLLTGFAAAMVFLWLDGLLTRWYRGAPTTMNVGGGEAAA